jgi:hypothetical protein
MLPSSLVFLNLSKEPVVVIIGYCLSFLLYPGDVAGHFLIRDIIRASFGPSSLRFFSFLMVHDPISSYHLHYPELDMVERMSK